jgi:hypothetical protein
MRLTVRAVCDVCNGGWMSDLETRAQSVLSSLIGGVAVSLAIDAQLLLGVWITKTAMLLEQVETITSTPFFSADELRRFAFGDTLEPPCRAAIWLGAYQGDSVAVADLANLTLTAQQNSSVSEGVVTTFAVGALLCQMLVHRAGEGVGRSNIVSLAMQKGDWSRALVPIWPIQDDVIAWPPYYAFDDRNWLTLIQRWHVPQPNLFQLRYRVEALRRHYVKS